VCRFAPLANSFDLLLSGLVGPERLLVSLKLLGKSDELRAEPAFASLNESEIGIGALSGELASLRSQPFS
jgi:hypothetical protein